MFEKVHAAYQWLCDNFDGCGGEGRRKGEELGRVLLLLRGMVLLYLRGGRGGEHFSFFFIWKNL